MAVRDLNELHPYVKHLAETLISKCAGVGINILITETYRSKEDQDRLYAQGRTSAGKIVTNAKGGQSMHNYRLAFDFVPLVHGAAAWDRPDLFARVGEIGESLGLTWGGNFKSIKDRPHFEWAGGLTIKDLQAGKIPKAPEIKPVIHWAQKHFDSLTAKGIHISEKRFDDTITRGEIFALLDRAIK